METVQGQENNTNWVVPAAMWPDYQCDENQGLGWSFKILDKRGRYISRVKYLGTTPTACSMRTSGSKVHDLFNSIGTRTPKQKTR